CESSAAAAFTDDDGNNRDCKPRHDKKIADKRFRLAAFFCTDSGIGAWGVDKGDDGTPKLLGHPHETQGFSIAFGIRHAKISLHPFFEGLPFLMADNHERPVIVGGEASDDGTIVAKRAVSMELEKVSE